MAQTTEINWTDATWNPVTGCNKISAGCKNCYAERLANRLQRMGQDNYANGFKVTLQPQMLHVPLGWKAPRTIFVSSMSDMFHKDIPLEYIKRVFDVMKRAHWHQFQVLTKRGFRLRELDTQLEWPDNVWQGVTVENADWVSRIDDLRASHARTKFLSIEPLLGPIPNMNLSGIDWVIVGGESGYGARPMNPEWVVDIRDQCLAAKVPFWFKQWGGVNKKKTGRDLEGRTWDELPRTHRLETKPSQLRLIA